MLHEFDNGVCVTCEDDGPFDEDSAALLQALNELDGPLGASRAVWDEAKHPRGPGGRFRSNVDRLKEAITKHRAGELDGHPFDGYSREQLRRVAKARGIELKRGEDRDSIAAKLLGHLSDGKEPQASKPETHTVVRGANHLPWLHRKARDVSLAMKARENGDGALAEIMKRQGFDAPPRLVSRDVMDKLVGSGRIELWRGVDPGMSMYDTGLTGREMNEQLKRGRFHPGFGLYGNGTYTSIDRRVAEVYGGIRDDGYSPDNIVRMTIDPRARVIDRDQLLRERDAYLLHVEDDAEAHIVADEGRFAAARGYDVVKVRNQSDGSDIENPSTGRDDIDQYVVLNRSVLIVQEEAP